MMGMISDDGRCIIIGKSVSNALEKSAGDEAKETIKFFDCV